MQIQRFFMTYISWAALAVVGAGLLAPAASHACSQPSCEFGTQVPGDMSSLPANLPGFFWHTDESVDAGPESVRLVRVADQHEVPLELTVLGGGRHEIKILELLAPDAPHVLILGSVCYGSGLADDSAQQLSLTTTDEQPLPDAGLGALIVSEPMHGPLNLASIDGGCAAPVESAYVDVSVALDAATSPWKDALVFETRVDGAPWKPSGFLPVSPPEGESWIGRGVDRVFATCESNEDVVVDGLAEGTHVVEIRARLPASKIVLASTKVEVLLTCLEAGSTSGDDGTSTGDTATTSTGGNDSDSDGQVPTTTNDPGGTDDTTGPADTASTGGPTSTGMTDTDAPTGGGPPGESDQDGGCSCRSPTAGDPVTLTLAALLLGGLARRRPRPHPCIRSPMPGHAAVQARADSSKLAG